MTLFKFISFGEHRTKYSWKINDIPYPVCNTGNVSLLLKTAFAVLRLYIDVCTKPFLVAKSRHNEYMRKQHAFVRQSTEHSRRRADYFGHARDQPTRVILPWEQQTRKRAWLRAIVHQVAVRRAGTISIVLMY